MRSWFHTDSRWMKIALLAWSAIVLFVTVRVILSPEAKTVYPLFSESGRLWWHGTDLYEPHRPKDAGDGFRYSPTFAALMAPLAILPDGVGGALWRIVNVAALLGAFAWFARSVLPPLDSKHCAWLALLLLPLCLQSINNGQANLIVIAALLAAVAAVNEQRWNLACVVLAFAFVIKIYPIALGMVLIVLYPRQLSWRLPLALMVAVLLPFLFQNPAYVGDQYGKWTALLFAEDRSAIPLEHMYRDLWLLIHLYGIPISRPAYALLQLLGGACVAFVCWRQQVTERPSNQVLTTSLTLTTTWMMLFGPATESSSFALLAPSLAWSIVESLDAFNVRRLLLWASCACFVFAVLFGGFRATLRVHELGIHSWGSVFYFAYLLAETQTKPALDLATHPKSAWAS